MILKEELVDLVPLETKNLRLMIDKIKNTYDKMTVVGDLTGDKSFHLAIDFLEIGRITASVACGKYAKFLINDFKALENKYGRSIYTDLDSQKVKGLFALSEHYM
jgi:hypothetical protein